MNYTNSIINRLNKELRSFHTYLAQQPPDAEIKDLEPTRVKQLHDIAHEYLTQPTIPSSSDLYIATTAVFLDLESSDILIRTIDNRIQTILNQYIPPANNIPPLPPRPTEPLQGPSTPLSNLKQLHTQICSILETLPPERAQNFNEILKAFAVTDLCTGKNKGNPEMIEAATSTCREILKHVSQRETPQEPVAPSAAPAEAAAPQPNSFLPLPAILPVRRVARRTGRAAPPPVEPPAVQFRKALVTVRKDLEEGLINPLDPDLLLLVPLCALGISLEESGIKIGQEVAIAHSNVQSAIETLNRLAAKGLEERSRRQRTEERRIATLPAAATTSAFIEPERPIPFATPAETAPSPLSPLYFPTVESRHPLDAEFRKALATVKNNLAEKFIDSGDSDLASFIKLCTSGIRLERSQVIIDEEVVIAPSDIQAGINILDQLAMKGSIESAKMKDFRESVKRRREQREALSAAATAVTIEPPRQTAAMQGPQEHRESEGPVPFATPAELDEKFRQALSTVKNNLAEKFIDSGDSDLASFIKLCTSGIRLERSQVIIDEEVVIAPSNIQAGINILDQLAMKSSRERAKMKDFGESVRQRREALAAAATREPPRQTAAMQSPERYTDILTDLSAVARNYPSLEPKIRTFFEEDRETPKDLRTLTEFYNLIKHHSTVQDNVYNPRKKKKHV